MGIFKKAETKEIKFFLKIINNNYMHGKVLWKNFLNRLWEKMVILFHQSDIDTVLEKKVAFFLAIDGYIVNKYDCLLSKTLCKNLKVFKDTFVAISLLILLLEIFFHLSTLFRSKLEIP